MDVAGRELDATLDWVPAAEISLREATAGSLVRGMITFDDETRKDDEDEGKKTRKTTGDGASICAKT